MRYGLLGMLVVLGLLGGCASLSKQECRNADWYLIGLEDGAEGKPVSTLGDHRKACARVDVTPEVIRYRAGHQEGVLEYCTRSRGYREGSRGNDYHGVCPSDREADFLEAYRDGRELHEIDSALSGLRSDMSHMRTRIADLESDIAQWEDVIVHERTSARMRRQYLDDIAAAQEEIGQVRGDLLAAEAERAQLNRERNELRRYHESLGY